MKKFFLLLACIFISTLSFGKGDSTLAKPKGAFFNIAATYHMPLGSYTSSGGYGSGFGIQGIVSDYYTSKLSLGFCIRVGQLPMIDQKDFVKTYFPSGYDIYYNYTGGNATFESIGLSLKYDFLTKSKLGLYTRVIPLLNIYQATGISGTDVRMKNGGTHVIITDKTEGTYISFPIGIGALYKAGAHSSFFAEAAYEVATGKKGQTLSKSSVPLFIGWQWSISAQ